MSPSHAPYLGHAPVNQLSGLRTLVCDDIFPPDRHDDIPEVADHIRRVGGRTVWTSRPGQQRHQLLARGDLPGRIHHLIVIGEDLLQGSWCPRPALRAPGFARAHAPGDSGLVGWRWRLRARHSLPRAPRPPARRRRPKQHLWTCVAWEFLASDRAPAPRPLESARRESTAAGRPPGPPHRPRQYPARSAPIRYADERHLSEAPVARQTADRIAVEDRPGQSGAHEGPSTDSTSASTITEVTTPMAP